MESRVVFELGGIEFDFRCSEVTHHPPLPGSRTWGFYALTNKMVTQEQYDRAAAIAERAFEQVERALKFSMTRL